ncbi:MAG TPA: hypothetical protein VHH33_05040 [Nitrososphaeraceae archaeon]|nr:hypothetical protein [Nitrososphaeraceae archaeon]
MGFNLFDMIFMARHDINMKKAGYCLASEVMVRKNVQNQASVPVSDPFCGKISL